MANAGNERLACLALGIRMRETADNMVRTARGLAEGRGSPAEQDIRIGVLKEEAEDMEEYIAAAETCGMAPGDRIHREFEPVKKSIEEDDVKDMVQVLGGFADAMHERAGDVVARSSYKPARPARSEAAPPLPIHGSVPPSKVGGPTPPGMYPFIDAERFWESLGHEERMEFLRDNFDFPAEENADYASRPFGVLDGEFQDALEGLAASGQLAKYSAKFRGQGR